MKIGNISISVEVEVPGISQCNFCFYYVEKRWCDLFHERIDGCIPCAECREARGRAGGGSAVNKNTTTERVVNGYIVRVHEGAALRDKIAELIREYSNEIRGVGAMGDRFITMGGVEELAGALERLFEEQWLVGGER